jgi:hypothetical protein
MIKSEYTMTILEASEGKVIAHVDDYTQYGTKVYLGKNDSPDNYIEIDLAIAEQAVRDREAQMLEESNG